MGKNTNSNEESHMATLTNDAFDLTQFMDIESILDEEMNADDQEIEHEGWWADTKDKVRCRLCNAAISKFNANP